MALGNHHVQGYMVNTDPPHAHKITDWKGPLRLSRPPSH